MKRFLTADGIVQLGALPARNEFYCPNVANIAQLPMPTPEDLPLAARLCDCLAA